MTGLTFEESLSNAAQITVSWTELTTSTETGGSPIIEYEVE